MSNETVVNVLKSARPFMEMVVLAPTVSEKMFIASQFVELLDEITMIVSLMAESTNVEEMKEALKVFDEGVARLTNLSNSSKIVKLKGYDPNDGTPQA